MITLVVLFGLFCSVYGAPNPPMAIPFPDARIVGGETVNIINYPYQISLMYYGSHICGGTIIAKNWIVTAAHCTDGFSAAQLSIRAGSSYRASGGQTVAVKQIYQHPSYNKNTIDYDISLLQLTSDISTTNAVPISLASQNDLPSTGTLLTVTGWGLLKENGSPASQLQMVEVPAVSQSTCKAAYGSSAITSRMLCAGYTSGGKDACQGDSGGPLVVNNKLTGVVSWGYGCARPNYPGIYSSVPSLRSYIEQVTGI